MGKWGNVKQKPLRHYHPLSGIFSQIQKYPDMMRYIWTYSGVIKAYSERCITLAYSELWYIQKFWIPGISKTLTHWEPEIYSESWVIQIPGIFSTGGILRTLPNIYNGALWGPANDYNWSHKLQLFFAISAFHGL